MYIRDCIDIQNVIYIYTWTEGVFTYYIRFFFPDSWVVNVSPGRLCSLSWAEARGKRRKWLGKPWELPIFPQSVCVCLQAQRGLLYLFTLFFPWKDTSTLLPLPRFLYICSCSCDLLAFTYLFSPSLSTLPPTILLVVQLWGWQSQSRHGRADERADGCVPGGLLALRQERRRFILSSCLNFWGGLCWDCFFVFF